MEENLKPSLFSPTLLKLLLSDVTVLKQAQASCVASGIQERHTLVLGILVDDDLFYILTKDIVGDQQKRQAVITKVEDLVYSMNKIYTSSLNIQFTIGAITQTSHITGLLESNLEPQLQQMTKLGLFRAFPNVQHWHLITGSRDLRLKQQQASRPPGPSGNPAANSLEGKAYRGTFCDTKREDNLGNNISQSFSISQYSGSVMTISHEIAHSLGSTHDEKMSDSEARPHCEKAPDGTSSYIMASVWHEKSVALFSECSLSDMCQYLVDSRNRLQTCAFVFPSKPGLEITERLRSLDYGSPRQAPSAGKYVVLSEARFFDKKVDTTKSVAWAIAGGSGGARQQDEEASCGNGIMEDGEECDVGIASCGLHRYCDCSCRLRSRYRCNPILSPLDDPRKAGCCSSGQMLQSSSRCAYSDRSNPCVLEQFCDGFSPVCPKAKRTDGLTCDLVRSQEWMTLEPELDFDDDRPACASGRCTNRANECKSIYGLYSTPCAGSTDNGKTCDFCCTIGKNTCVCSSRLTLGNGFKCGNPSNEGFCRNGKCMVVSDGKEFELGGVQSLGTSGALLNTRLILSISATAVVCLMIVYFVAMIVYHGKKIKARC